MSEKELEEMFMLSRYSTERIEQGGARFTSIEARVNGDFGVVVFPEGTEQFKTGTGKRKKVCFRLPTGAVWQIDWNKGGRWLNPAPQR